MKQVFKLLQNSSLLVVALFLVSNLCAASPTSVREFSKTINKQYNITTDGLVNLTNKYGKIDIKTWDKNSVRISVKIIVNARDESAAQEVFDRININFFNSTSTVGAETEIAEKKSSWWSWGSSSDDFSINYEVYMPPKGSLQVEAKYCDVFAVAIAGKGDFSIKYGNAKLGGLGEDSSIELAYGNGTIGKVRDLAVDLAYGNLDVSEASDINIDVRYGNFGAERAGDVISESRYSNFKLGEIREFRNNGKYDNIEIAFAEEVVCETHYTNVQIARLSRRLSLDMAYGSSKTQQVDAGFSEINLNGRYTDFKVHMGSGVTCSLDLSGNYADIRLPSSGVKTNYDAQNGSSHEVRGTMGSGGNSTVVARMSYGGITVAKN